MTTREYFRKLRTAMVLEDREIAYDVWRLAQLIGDLHNPYRSCDFVTAYRGYYIVDPQRVAYIESIPQRIDDHYRELLRNLERPHLPLHYIDGIVG